MAKLIFVTGGVVSSLGKGIVAASLGNILQSEGFSINIKKLDPYLNIDPGTMNPIQHGEVFVTNDGGETDLDLGHYERFTGKPSSKHNNITSGKIYQKLLEKERNGDYLGKTVQVVPHVTDLVKDFIIRDIEKYDFTICEIGGTVGDIEGQAFLESIRQIKFELGREKTLSVHVTLLPYIAASNELKTKPTQNSVKDLMSYGITAEILVCRTSIPISQDDRKKIAAFCNLDVKNVIEAPDVSNIYEIPLIYERNGLGKSVLNHFNMKTNQDIFNENSQNWSSFIDKMNFLTKTTNVAIVGKYTGSKDAYKSLIEAITHAGVEIGQKINIKMIDSREIKNQEDATKILENQKAIIIAGGFGADGIFGKLEAIKYCRQNNKPMLGICLGMQLSVIEFARNVARLNVTSSEFNDITESFFDAKYIVDTMQNWKTDDGKLVQKQEQIGGSMRLGSYTSVIEKNTLAYKIYQKTEINERHRHRFEVDIKYKNDLEKFGAKFSSLSPDGKLPEIFEIQEYTNENGQKKQLKFFIACQYHPEFNSSPLYPNPIFVSLLKSCD